MKQQNKRKIRQIIAMLLACAMLTGLIPASLPETVHAAAVSAAEQKKWYEVTAKINSSWSAHIEGEITLTNNSEEAIQDWQIEFPWDAQITSMWGANYEPTENGYIITPADDKRNLAAGASVSIGFMAEGEDSVLEKLVTEDFFRNNRVHITTAEEREKMPPEPSREAAPTVELSLETTASLMLEPTETPILEPAVSPTLEPTASPTVAPTATPTLAPTATPTLKPTASPTLAPTVTPTITPTAEPTEEPTTEPAEDFYVYTDTTLTEDLTCRNLFLMGGALTVNGCTITVQGDYLQTEKNGSLQNGTIDIRGNAHVVAGALTAKEQSVFRVDGTMDVRGNSLSFTKSELIIHKDLTCSTAASNTFSNSSLQIAGNVITENGELNFSSGSQVTVGGDLQASDAGWFYINGSTTKIDLAGNFVIDSQKQSKLLTGSLTLGGNLIQTEDSAEDSLKTNDSFQLIFRAEKEQQINLAYPSAVTLGTMDFRESAGMDVPDEIHGKEIYGFAKMCQKEKLDLYLTNIVLKQDERILCNNVSLYGNTLNIGKYQLTVDGNVNLSLGSFSASGGRFQVEGDCRCDVQREFSLSKAEMQIAGNLTAENGKLYFTSGSRVDVRGDLLASGMGWFSTNGTTIDLAGDFVIDSQKQSSLLGGSMTLGGDLIQTENSAENSLKINDPFQLIFRAERRQKISLAYPETVTLGTMDFRESAGMDVPDEIHGKEIYGFAKMGEKEKLDLYLVNTVLKQDEKILCNNVSLYGNALNIGKQHLTVEGNINLSLGSFSSSGGRFQVEGDCCCDVQREFSLSKAEMQVLGNLTAENGKLYFTSGSRVDVRGDLLASGMGWFSTNGTTIDLVGDFVIDSQKQSSLLGGSMTLGGDLIQTEDSAEDSLKIGSSFNLILNGKEEQSISLWDEEAAFGTLDLSGCTSLVYDGEFYGSEIRGIEHIRDDSEVVSHCTRNIATGNGSIAGDLYIDGELSFEEGASLTLESDFYHDGALKMGGGTLKVKGDYSADSAVVDVTDGKLTVDGDMDVKKDASLSLKTPESRLNVRGDLNISSTKTSSNQMTDGVIRIGGDINCSEYASTESFSLNGTKLILNGTELQQVCIYYDPDRAPYEIDMTKSAGVTFWGGVISAKSIKGWDKIRNASILVEDLQQNLEQDEVFHGDLMICGKSLNLAGYDFVVEGDLNLIDTILCPNEGLLETGGNYSMCGSSSLVMINTADRLQIGGDFRTYSGVDHTNLLQRGRIGLYSNFYQYGNEYAFNSGKDLLVAFMGNYTHYYWFTNHDHSQFSITYGKAEKLDWDQEIDPTISNAIIYGIQAGLRELSDSLDEVLAAAAMGAAVGLGITLAGAALPGTAVFAGMIGIILTIYEFYEDYKHISSIKGSYEQIREAAKLVTIFIVTSAAAWLGGKIGAAVGSAASGKVHEVSMAVEKEIKDQKIWKSTCEWMKKNVLENAKAFTDDVKNLLNEAVVGMIKGWLDNGKAKILYKYQNLKADDIYAELKNLVDEDALDYLQKEFYNAGVDAHPNQLKLLEDTADCIKASQEALGKNLNLDEVTYVNEEWSKRLPGSAKTKQQLKENIVNYIKNGKIYVKNRLIDKCKLI